MGGESHGASSHARRSACRQGRTARKMPRRPHLWRRSGHGQPKGIRGGGEFVLKTDHRLNQLRQLHHLHLWHRYWRGNLTVRKRLTRTGSGSVVIFFIMPVPFVLLRRKDSSRHFHASINPPAAHRSRDHQGQHQKCEDLPEAFHWMSGGKTRPHRQMVKVEMLFLKCPVLRRLQRRHGAHHQTNAGAQDARQALAGRCWALI